MESRCGSSLLHVKPRGRGWGGGGGVGEGNKHTAASHKRANSALFSFSVCSHTRDLFLF